LKSNKIFIAILLVFLKSAIASATTLTAADEVVAFNSSGLWQKALDVFQKNSDWFPGKVTIFSEVLDRRGRSDSITKLHFNISIDDKGAIRTELMQAIKDGKDVSADMKKKLEIREAQNEKTAKKKDTLTISLADSPFNPDRQQDVTVRAYAEKQFLFGKICQRFDFSFRTEIVRKDKAEKITWIGKAWLEESSGIPVKLEFSFEPLPKRVYSLRTIYLYEITATGDWFLKEIKVQGQGGFLFIKKGFRSTTNFDHYQRRGQSVLIQKKLRDQPCVDN
jgi:hypothetical protein